MSAAKPSGLLLVAATDERYAGQASLALISAVKATTHAVRCVVLADELSATTSDRMRAAFARADADLEIVDLPGRDFEGLPLQAPWGRTTFARLFLARVLGGYAARILWLDADTLTVGSIDELLAFDLQGFPVGAVGDAGVPFVSAPSGVIGWRRLGIPPAVSYFNAGVLLIDVERWKEQRVEERTLELIRESPAEAVFADQSPLNAVIAGSWLPLDERWNVRPRNTFTVGLGGWIASRGGIRRSAPASILHWAGHFKPWNADHSPSPDRSRYVQAWERWIPDFPFAVSLRHLAWYARNARFLVGRG